MCIFGDTGEGKTLLATAIILHEYKNGHKILSNIDFNKIEYQPINDAAPLMELDFNEPYTVFIDELGITTSEGMTKATIGLSNLMAQSRKMIGEKSHLILTAQSQHQANIMIKSMLDIIAYPYLFFDEKEDGAKIPKWGYLDIFQKVKHRDIFVNTGKKLFNNLDKVCEYYDTAQIVEKFKTGKINKLKEKYSDHIGGNISNLKAILEEYEGLSKTDAIKYARMIVNDL